MKAPQLRLGGFRRSGVASVLMPARPDDDPRPERADRARQSASTGRPAAGRGARPWRADGAPPSGSFRQRDGSGRAGQSRGSKGAGGSGASRTDRDGGGARGGSTPAWRNGAERSQASERSAASGAGWVVAKRVRRRPRSCRRIGAAVVGLGPGGRSGRAGGARASGAGSGASGGGAKPWSARPADGGRGESPAKPWASRSDRPGASRTGGGFSGGGRPVGTGGRSTGGPRGGRDERSRDGGGGWDGRNGTDARRAGADGGRPWSAGAGPSHGGGGGGPRGGGGSRPRGESAGGAPWDRTDRPGGGRPRGDEPRELPAPGRGWGALARKGTKNLGDRLWEGAAPVESADAAAPEQWEPEVWVLDEGPQRSGPPDGTRVRDRWAVPESVAGELAAAAGARRSDRLKDRLRDGVRAFERDRFKEARSILQSLADEAPGAATVRELLGLTYYRLGQWPQTIRELDAYAELSGSTTSHPVLADANRALGRHGRVAELWDELKTASPDAATVAEGRIVAAGSLADRGDLAGAIALLEAGKLGAKQPSDHHLRLWYALADLYERAGEVPRARDLFERITRHDPSFVDAADRRRALG